MALRRLTRDQISRIVNGDPEAIRAFEDLFRQATSDQPAEIVALRSDVDALAEAPAGSDAIQALDWANRLEDRLNNITFAQLIKNFDQAAGAPDTATLVTWDNVILGRGVSIGSPASRLVFERSGIYEIDISVQIGSNSSAEKNIWLWYRINGADVPNSSVIETERINNGFSAISRTEFFDLNANDYVELVFAVDDTDLLLNAEAATAFAPAAPAAIATVTQVYP